MSYFSELPITAQNIIMLQFEFFGKMFLLGFFFILALCIIFIWRKNQKDTPYLLVALVRTWLYFLSWVYLYFTPLFIVFLYPQMAIDEILKGVFMTYGYSTWIIGIILFFNILFYGPLVMAKLGGLDIASKNTSKVMDDLLGKYKKFFKR